MTAPGDEKQVATTCLHEWQQISGSTDQDSHSTVYRCERCGEEETITVYRNSGMVPRTSEDDKLIERLARAKCIADGEYDPDDDVSAIFEKPTKAWELFYHDAKCFLAMKRAYEVARGERTVEMARPTDRDPNVWRTQIWKLRFKDTDL